MTPIAATIASVSSTTNARTAQTSGLLKRSPVSGRLVCSVLESGTGLMMDLVVHASVMQRALRVHLSSPEDVALLKGRLILLQREHEERQSGHRRHVLLVTDAVRHRAAVDRGAEVRLPQQRPGTRICLLYTSP